MPDLNGMMLFAAVVRAKGFSQAARDIGQPKSTISRKVAQLEEQLGVRLLQRDTRNLSLTQVGALFFQHCDSISHEIEAAKAIIENTQIDTIPFNQVSKEYAQLDVGTDIEPLEKWRKAHWDFFESFLKESGGQPTEDMLVVCVQFKTIWPKLD